MAQTKRFKNFIADFDFLNRISGQRNTDRIADTHPKQIAHPNGRFDRASGKPTRLSYPKVDRCVGRFSQLLVCGCCHEYVRRFTADLEFVEIVVLQDFDMVQATFDHRIWAWLAVFLQQLFLKATSIHTNTDGTVIVFSGLNDFFYPLFVADVAWVDPKACSPRLSGLNPSFVVEVNIGHDRYRAFATNLLHRRSTFRVRH